MEASAWPEEEISAQNERLLLEVACLRPFGVNYLEGGELHHLEAEIYRRRRFRWVPVILYELYNREVFVGLQHIQQQQ